MSTIRRHVFSLLLALLAAGLGGAAWGQTEAAAGRFLSVTGAVNVVGSDGAARPADRGSDLRAGETVMTGDNALAQVRMTDGSLLSLRAGSEFKLEQFSYAGKGDTSASFVVSVVKGGFRTITGLIAQANRRGYRITTPAATIGVRGTHFEVVHVLPQIASREAPAGTYNHVYEGITTFQNPTGIQLLVSREQTGFNALQAGAAPVLVAPPAALFGRPTPIPRAAVPMPQSPARAEGQTPSRGENIAAPGMRPVLPVVRETTPVLRTTPLEPTTALRTLEPTTTVTTTISPTTTLAPTLDTSTTLRTLDAATTTLSPTTSTLISPITTTTTTTTSTITDTASKLLSPTTKSTTNILQSPTTSTNTIKR
jgi:hypothetical protein